MAGGALFLRHEFNLPRGMMVVVVVVLWLGCGLLLQLAYLKVQGVVT
jgi:hypothetical protein